jgi:hypothetical protein
MGRESATTRPEAANLVVRPSSDTTVDLNLLCQSKIADVLEAAETECEAAPSISTSTKTVTAAASTCVQSTMTGRVQVANAVVAQTTMVALETPASCMSDAQANVIAGAFKSMLTNPNRLEVQALAGDLLADEFMGQSVSVNSIAGKDVSDDPVRQGSKYAEQRVAFEHDLPIPRGLPWISHELAADTTDDDA